MPSQNGKIEGINLSSLARDLNVDAKNLRRAALGSSYGLIEASQVKMRRIIEHRARALLGAESDGLRKAINNGGITGAYVARRIGYSQQRLWHVVDWGSSAARERVMRELRKIGREIMRGV